MKLKNLMIGLLLIAVTGSGMLQAQVCGALIDTNELVYHPYEIFSITASKTAKNEVIFTVKAVRDIEFCGLTQENLKGLHAHHTSTTGCTISDTSYFYEGYSFKQKVPYGTAETKMLPNRQMDMFLEIVADQSFKQEAFREFNQIMRESYLGVLDAKNSAQLQLRADRDRAHSGEDH